MKNTLTKRALYLTVVKNTLSMKMILGYVILMIVVNTIAVLFNIRDSVIGIWQSIFVVLGIGVIGGVLLAVLIAVIHSFFAFSGINLIKKQEQVLGFNFTEEMRKYGVTEPFYSSPNWYIDARSGMVTAFRRDYIVALEELKKPTNETDTPSGIPLAQVIVVGVDGKRRKILNDFIRIFYFERWFLSCQCTSERCICPELSDAEAEEWLERYEKLPYHSLRMKRQL